MNSTEKRAAVSVAIVLGLAFHIWIAIENRTGWGADFNQFYAAGQLTGSGHLYDWDALRKAESVNGGEGPTARLPVVLYGHKILARLPFRVAHYIWAALSIAALLVFASIWPGAGRTQMFLALAWSMPAIMTLLFGQDTPFWLMFFAAGLLLMQRNKPLSAGVAFSLCICKFHIALGIPIMLIAQQRWRTLIAGAGSVLILLASCFAIEGPEWPLRYAKMVRMPEFAAAHDVIPTLSALTWRLPWPLTTEVALGLAIAVLLWMFCRRTSDLGMAGAAAAACGMLVAHHALFADTILLIPLGVMTIRRKGAPVWLKAFALLVLSPTPFLLAALWHKPLVWQALIAPFVIGAVIAAYFFRYQPTASRAVASRSS
jgi:hypothetical protein